MVNKYFYNTVLSQTFSPCKNYLIAGDTFGQITVFHLIKVINPDSHVVKKGQYLKNKFTVEEDVQINSLLTTDNYLIVGTTGEISGYTWKNVVSSKDAKVAWKIDLPNIRDSFDRADINTLICNNDDGFVYAGCGDNNIYVINVETGKSVQVLKGHSDYIHSIHSCGNDLISGGEDGVVNIWDIRDKQVTNKIEPYKNNKICRSDLGKWIGAVSINEDWVLCGGGPRLSLWHVRTLNTSTIFPIEDEGIHVAQFCDDKVLTGGRSKLFYQMNFNGDVITTIPISSITLYSAVYIQEPFTALCLAGSSPKIDICSNFNYKDQVLMLY